jgi:hypothetical protein
LSLSFEFAILPIDKGGGVMAYIANSPETYKGKVVGDGHCVAFVKAASGAPATTQWVEGAKVKGAVLTTGTAIATFQNGKYTNDTTGKSHAAIYVRQDASGITVWDQWKTQPVHTRLIRFQGGSADPRNDGDAFAIID